MPDAVIRPARRGDGPGLAAVWLDTGAYYAQLDPDRFQLPQAAGMAEWFEDHWLLASHDDHDRFMRVAELDGQIAGFVSASLEQPFETAQWQLLRYLAWRRLAVHALVVSTRYWRRGVGRQLLVAAEDWGRSGGATLIQLDTAIDSPVSVPFYERGMGYVRQSLVFRKRL
ncbi:MAG: GNAT family N-acetyltransferase [Chloroflexi bacterium]|nr:MAG: GNAT family N-acetyltransferase [Chloroflexota bacterium]